MTRRVSRGLPYSAVLALLGWLMLSQGPAPAVVVGPPTAALQQDVAEVWACGERNGAVVARQSGGPSAEDEPGRSDCDSDRVAAPR
ncbi:MAG: hypothetical protein AAGA11_13490 [Pseudomonadota bacterium]